MSSPEIFSLLPERLAVCVNGNRFDLPCIVDGVNVGVPISWARKLFSAVSEVVHLGAADVELVQETLNDFLTPSGK